MFTEILLSYGGIKMLLFLLKKEAETGDGTVYESSSSSDTANQERNENDRIDITGKIERECLCK